MAIQIIDGNQTKTKIPREGKLVQQARPENARRNSSKGNEPRQIQMFQPPEGRGEEIVHGD